ncbi:hypothetical protein [Mariniluteicoccus flavus]
MYDMYPADWTREQSREKEAKPVLRRRQRRTDSRSPEIPARLER